MQTAPTNKNWAYLGLLTVAAIYGGWAIVGKEAMKRGAFPFIFAFYRAAGGTILLTIPLVIVPGLTPENKGLMQGLGLFSLGSDTKRIVILGILMACNVAGMIGALSRLSAITCSVLQPMIPIATCVLSYFYLNEDMGILKIVSILCSTCGAVCVVTLGESKSSGEAETTAIEQAIGIAFITMNIAANAVYFVMQKDVLRKYSPIFLTAASYAIATCVLLPVAAVTLRAQNRGGSHEWTMFEDHTIWYCVAYGIAFTTAINYSIMAWANKVTTPVTVTTSCCLQPLFGAVMQFIFLNMMVTKGQAVGAAFIIVGLAIYARAMSTAPDVPSREEEPIAPSADKMRNSKLYTASGDLAQVSLFSGLSKHYPAIPGTNMASDSDMTGIANKK